MLRNRKLACLTVALSLLTTSFLRAQEQSEASKSVEGTTAKKSGEKTKPGKKKNRKQSDKKKAAKADAFLRLERDDKKKPTTLQTAVTRFVKGKGDKRIVVDLVSAVHVADRGYYEQLNKLFTEYDVVLYELVAPKGMRPVMGQQRDASNPVSFLQDSMKSMLNLESQTELVNYRKRNFVHADMTPTEISKKMDERGDTGLTVMMDVMSDMMKQMNKMQSDPKFASQASEVDLMSLLFADDSDQKMKLMMAEQFVAQGSLDQGLGKTLNRMLIKDRNETAMKVFEKEMAKGHKKIAIFYGAAHMPDFQQRLLEEQGMRFKHNKWLTAWDLSKTKADTTTTKPAEPDPLKALLKLLNDASK